MEQTLDKGQAFEREFLGPKVLSGHLPIDYTAQDAIRWAIRHQRSFFGWNSSNPPTDLGKKLFEAVKKRLRPAHAKRLRLYVSVGTTLDWYWGTDLLFKLFDHVVLCDATVGRKKNGKGDILIRKQDLNNEVALETLAAHIAKRLYESRSKITNLNKPREYRPMRAVTTKSKTESHPDQVAALRKIFELED